MIDPGHPRLSIVRQCEVAAISRTTFYRTPAGESAETLALMRLIDETFLECPFYGARQMVRHLRRLGWAVGRRRVRRLMRKIGPFADLSGAQDERAASRAQGVSLSVAEAPH
jgi:putative transposase